MLHYNSRHILLCFWSTAFNLFGQMLYLRTLRNKKISKEKARKREKTDRKESNFQKLRISVILHK